MSVPDFDAHHLTATGDGDARVPADVSATDGLPDRPPPLVADATALKISYRFEAGWKFCRLAFKDNDLHLPVSEASVQRYPAEKIWSVGLR